MDIDQIKSVPVSYLAERLGGRFAHTKGKDEWWYSPLRPEEKTPSFKIDTSKNFWKDFGHHLKGGSVIDLYLDFHGISRDDKDGFKQAVEYISQLSPVDLVPFKRDVVKQYSETFKILSESDKIWADPLKAELHRRCFQKNVTEMYMKQVQVLNTETGKKAFGFSLQNDKGGLEISIPKRGGGNFKLCHGKKGITTLEGKGDVFIFEGWSDFVTWVHVEPTLEFQSHIILNSTSLVHEAEDAIKALNPSKAYLFMDNDRAGELATAGLGDILHSLNIPFGSMNHYYEPHKDLNDWWVASKGTAARTTRSPLPSIKLKPS
jgi:hypothetical protein